MFLSLLAVVGVRSVLAHVVLLDEQWIHCEVWVNREGYESHLGTLLHHLGIIYGIIGRRSPGERTVVLHQHGRCVVGIDFTDVQNLVHDDIACLQFILSLYLCLGHVARARDILIEVVGMCGADVGDVLACLCKSRSVGGVGVYHALDVGEGLI